MGEGEEMKLNKLSFNIFYLIFIVVGFFLCLTDRVSWWVFGLIILSDIKINLEWKKK